MESATNGFEPEAFDDAIQSLQLVASRAQRGTRSTLKHLDVTGLLASPPTPVVWVVEDYVQAGVVTLLHGDGGLGKSLLAQLIARSVAGGSAVLERGTLKGRVVIIDGENPESEIARRLHGLQFGDVADQLTYIRASEPFLAAADAEQVLTDLAKDAGLVVLDSQRALWGGDEREAQEVRALYKMLSRVAETTGAAILVLHHDRRTGDYSGSSDLNAAADARLHLTRNKDHDDRLDLTHGKSRSGPRQPPLTYSMTPIDGTYAFQIHTGGRVNATAQTAAAWIHKRGETTTTNDIAARFNINERTVRRFVESGDFYRLGIQSDGGRHTPTTILQTIAHDPDMPKCPANSDVHQEQHNQAVNTRTSVDMDTRGHDPMSAPQTRMVEPKTSVDTRTPPTGGHVDHQMSTPQEATPKPQLARDTDDAQKDVELVEFDSEEAT